MTFIHRIVSIALLTTACTTAFANQPARHVNFSLYGGWQDTHLSTGSFVLIGNQPERIVPYRDHDNDALWGAGVNVVVPTPCNPRLMTVLHELTLGIDAFHFAAKQRGATLDFGFLDDFNYRLHINSTRILLNAQWIFPAWIWPRVYPFFIGGIGVAFNTAKYADAPNPDVIGGNGITMPNNTDGVFAYDIGAGIQADITCNLNLSLRYLYTDLGKATTGYNASLPVTSLLHIPMTSQSVILGLTYSVDA